MAHFRGTVDGNRGGASRLGTKASGLYARAQAWGGQVDVALWVQDGEDWVRISVGPNNASYGDDGQNHCLYSGKLADLRAARWPVLVLP